MIATLGVRSGAAAAGAAIADLRTGANYRAHIREIGIFLAAATQAQVGLIRPLAAGTASTSQAGVPVDPADAAPASLIGTAWSAAPTIAGTPAYLRRATLPANIGAGLVWVFNKGDLVVPISSSLLLWNFGAGANGVLDIYIQWEE